MARVGWVFQRAASQKQLQKQQQRHSVATTGSSSNKSNTINNSKPQKRQQKQHEQQEKQHTTRKASIKQQQKKSKHNSKSNKSSANILEGQKRQGCVSHTTTGARRPQCGRAKPRKIKAKRCGPSKGGGRRRGEERLPVEIRWDTGKVCLNWLRSKGSNHFLKKLLLTFWKVKHWTVGGSKAATITNSSKNSGSSKPQQEHKQEKQQQAAESGAAQTAHNNPATVRAKRCGRWRLPMEFRLCSRFFFLDASKICNNWSLTFSEVLWGQINCKIVLDILQKPPGFHTTAREPKRAQLALTLQTPPKYHEKTPSVRKRATMGAGGGKSAKFCASHPSGPHPF